MRGTPCIYHGSEIGMTNVEFPSIDDYRDVEIKNFHREHLAKGGTTKDFLKAVYVNGRDNVRTPIQWDTNTNAGFSEVEPWIKVNPNYVDINVEKALKEPNSIFYFYQKMLAYRKANPTLIYGTYKDLNPSDEHVFVYRRSDAEATFFVILNFSEAQIPMVRYLPNMKALTLEVSNYKTTSPDILRPWESRLYRLNKK